MYRLYKANGEVREFNRREFHHYLASKGQSISFDETNKQYQKQRVADYTEGSYLFYTRYKTIYAVRRQEH